MHIKRFSKKKSAKASALTAKVEKVVLSEKLAPFLDVEDDDVLSYVENLVNSCQTIGPMEKFSLLSRESALEAIAKIEGTQRTIKTHLKTARALKSLLESRQEGQDQPQ